MPLAVSAATALLLSSVAVVAQDAMAPAQTTENPTVAAGEATHIAMLEGGTAWLYVDPQNNTIRWTIELTGNVNGAWLVCGDDAMADGAAPPAAGAPAVGEAAPAGAAAEAEGDIDLARGNTTSPLQGDTANVAAEIINAANEGACAVVVRTAAGEVRADLELAPADTDGAAAGAPAPAPGQAPAGNATPPAGGAGAPAPAG
jgi:hypothetical protein